MDAEQITTDAKTLTDAITAQLLPRDAEVGAALTRLFVGMFVDINRIADALQKVASEPS